MTRFITTAAAVLFAAAALAQDTTKTTSTSTTTTTTTSPIVAVVNGETITRAQLDHMWERIGPQMQDAYMKSGGKAAFLENYLRKRLVVQEAIKHNFAQRPDVQEDMDLAKESALFDRYIKDEVASSVITESDLVNYYNSHQSEFAKPESVHARHIVIVPGGKHAANKEAAQALLQKIAGELAAAMKDAPDAATATSRLRSRFIEEASLYSDDGTAKSGGDLGWITRGTMDANFEKAAFGLQAGALSPVVESAFGLHLIFVEGTRPGGLPGLDVVRQNVRDRLIMDKQALIMGEVAKLSNELRRTASIRIITDNID